jgi:hypothetical protein
VGTLIDLTALLGKTPTKFLGPLHLLRIVEIESAGAVQLLASWLGSPSGEDGQEAPGLAEDMCPQRLHEARLLSRERIYPAWRRESGIASAM